MSTALIELVIVVAVALGVGGALWLARRRRRSLGRAAACVPIAELTPDSVATIRGRVVLDEVLESPFARARCAYWRLQVSYQEYSRSQEGLAWFQSIAREARSNFRLRDATGTVRIAGTCAGFDLLPMVYRAELPAHMEQFLASQGVPLKTEGGTARVFGFEESPLVEGMEVRVTGRVLAGADGLIIGAPNIPVQVTEERPDWA